MAVEWVREVSADRGGSTEGIANESGPALVNRRTHRRAFMVKMTDVTDGSVTAEAAPLIPQFGQTHPKDSTLTVNALRTEAVNGTAFVFRVNVEYQRVGSATVSNPTAEPPSIRWSSVPTELPTMFDRNGHPYTTTAGEFFDGTMNKPWTDVGLNYSFNVTNFNANLIFTHVNRVNAQPWTTIVAGTIPKRCGLFKELYAEQRWLNGFPYFRMTYVIFFRSHKVSGTLIDPQKNVLSGNEVGWLHVVANVGYMLKVQGQQGQPELTFIEVKGLPVRRPRMIDIAGTSTIPDPKPETAVYIGFENFQEADFTGLGMM